MPPRKSRSKYRYPLYEVHWLDAEGKAGWSDPTEKIERVPVINIGFLISEDTEYVKLAAAYVDKQDDMEVSSTDIIPKNMIQTMKEIKVSYVNKVSTSPRVAERVNGSNERVSDSGGSSGVAKKRGT